MKLFDRLKTLKTLWELSKDTKTTSSNKLENVLFLIKEDSKSGQLTERQSLERINRIQKIIYDTNNINILYIDGQGSSVTKIKL